MRLRTPSNASKLFIDEPNTFIAACNAAKHSNVVELRFDNVRSFDSKSREFLVRFLKIERRAKERLSGKVFLLRFLQALRRQKILVGRIKFVDGPHSNRQFVFGHVELVQNTSGGSEALVRNNEGRLQPGAKRGAA